MCNKTRARSFCCEEKTRKRVRLLISSRRKGKTAYKYIFFFMLNIKSNWREIGIIFIGKLVSNFAKAEEK